MKKLFVVMLVALLLLGAGCSSNDGTGEVFAKINGEPVYQEEMDYYFAAISAFKASVKAGTILFKSPTKP